MPEPVLGLRAWARGAAIAVALVVHGIYAMPAPTRVTRADLDSAEGKEELGRWFALVQGLGLPLTRAEFEDVTMSWSKAGAELHTATRKPFRPFLKFTGTGQAWALFASPDTHPHRLEVYVRREGAWQVVYRRNTADHSWMDATFRYRRVRGVYDGSTGRSGPPYWNFTRWVAKRAMLEWPDVDQVRVQMVRTHTVLPWEPPDPAETVRLQHTHKRTAILPEDGLVP
jgi:hypothetical protein